MINFPLYPLVLKIFIKSFAICHEKSNKNSGLEVKIICSETIGILVPGK